MSNEELNKKFKITIEGKSIILPKNEKPVCKKVIPRFDLRDAVIMEESNETNYFLFVESIKMERIE